MIGLRLSAGLARKSFFKYGIRRVSDTSSKVTNLGGMTEYLLANGVPNLLQENLENSRIDDFIQLRFLTGLQDGNDVIIRDHLVKGYVKYNSAMTMIRLFLTSFVLEPDHKLRVISLKSDGTNGNGQIVIKWQSYPPGNGAGTIERQSATVMPKDDNYDFKVINGKFIFDLNEGNDKIVMHTVADVEMIDNRDIKKFLSMACP